MAKQTTSAPASSKSKLTRVIISIIFLALGASSVVASIQSALTLDTAGIVASALGVLMFITGIVSFCGKIIACRVLGVLICVLSIVKLVMVFLASGVSNLDALALPLTQALLAWLFFSKA